ncbi:MAG: hypothetical protein DMF89_00365 [Acidobacteria bacterium]|nr:MAG: hypothetical protein DMF89_00365 [Acidobacteriota bacterium]
MLTTQGDWPTLTRDSWPDTYATLHMWTQVVGKVCLALTPLVNHFWNVTLPSAAEAFWRVLLAIRPVFDRFRSDFVGKCSPVHFFWGSFDLAVTRFSGRRAPARPDADRITREAYSHEEISHGFWPGGGAVTEAAFYAFAAPEPEGLKTASVKPSAAYYHPDLPEFILPYEAVRSAASPTAELEAFLQSTYDAAADLASWNRSDLERRTTRST